MPMQAQAEERALLKAIASGDAKALERLFARAETRVFRFLMRLVKNQAIAEELLNEVFLTVWQNAHRYEGRSEPLTWMLSIAHNKAISALRKKTEVLGIADEAARDLVAEEDTPDIAAQKHDKSAKIRACIAELSAEHRTVLDLVYYQEQSVAEVAEVLGIPENTVKTRMFYAQEETVGAAAGTRHRPRMAVMRDERSEAAERARRDRGALALVRFGQARCESRARVERYMKTHPEVKAHLALAREEADATVASNEAIAAPGPDALATGCGQASRPRHGASLRRAC